MGEELNQSLEALAERGVACGHAAVLEDARSEAGTAGSGGPSWRLGLVAAFGTAVVALAVVGIAILLVGRFGSEVAADNTTPAAATPVIAAGTFPGGEPDGSLNEISDLAVAPDGRLWAATSAGVVRWDTTTGAFEIFTEENGIPAREVTTVAVAPDGVVWAVGEGWIARYDSQWQVYSAANVPELSGDLGPFLVDNSGAAWVIVGLEDLVRFDGVWTQVSTAGGTPVFPGSDAAAVGSDGSLWFSTHDAGITVFDGTVWRQYTEEDGAPQAASNLAVASDGSIWVGDPLWYDGDKVGLARFDGFDWEVVAIQDGLFSNEGDVFTGQDGAVWVVHETGLSYLDGADWTTRTFDEPLGGSLTAIVDAVGTLWVAGDEGVLGFSGAESSMLLAVPEAEESPAYPAITLTPTADEEPRIFRTAIGNLEFVTLEAPPGHPLFDTATTPFGVVVSDGNALRLSTDGLTWDVFLTGVSGARIMTDGTDLIVYNEGYVRYTWDGDSWVEKLSARLPGQVQGLAFGPSGAVVLVDNTVYFSTDGIAFAPAEVGPGVGRADSAPSGCEGSWPGISLAGPDTGPILVTDSGYVLLAPASVSWDTLPMCEPLVWFSADGSRWELVTEQSPFGESMIVTDVAVHEGRNVAMGEGVVWASDDGIDWERVDVPQLRSARGIAAGDLGWVLVGESSTSNGAALPVDMWFSGDGLTWDGPHVGPEGIGWAYFHIEPTVGSDAIVSVTGTHDGLILGRLQE